MTDDDLLRRAGQALELLATLKPDMIKRGVRSATAKCPRCGGTVRASLVGPKRHLYLACETEDCISMIE